MLVTPADVTSPALQVEKLAYRCEELEEENHFLRGDAEKKVAQAVARANEEAAKCRAAEEVIRSQLAQVRLFEY